MSSEDQIVKNSKFVKAINNMEDDIDYEQNYFDSEYEYLQKEIDNDKFEQIVLDIKQNLMEFINDKSLPLCEYLTFTKLKKFIKKEIIYNYSRTCQYENKWDEITKSCRGLILDQDGNVVAKGFDKFFNIEEHNLENIPNEPFEVFEKLDGSLGILFWYQGKWILATKGSFVSEQAMRGREGLR